MRVPACAGRVRDTWRRPARTPERRASRAGRGRAGAQVRRRHAARDLARGAERGVPDGRTEHPGAIAMSREAFGDPPERQEVPECCPNCGSDFYMPGCTHCNEVQRRCAAESEAMALRGQLGAASGWIVEALKVLDTV